MEYGGEIRTKVAGAGPGATEETRNRRGQKLYRVGIEAPCPVDVG